MTVFMPGQRVRINSLVVDRLRPTTRPGHPIMDMVMVLVGREGTVREHDRQYSFSTTHPDPVCICDKVIVDLDDDGSGVTLSSCDPGCLDLIDG